MSRQQSADAGLSESLDWLSGGGEMGKLIRSMDWSTTPLGPFASWPQSLRTTVSLCLSSTFPILIAWGPERVQLYNDSYRPITGAKHPHSMGQRFNECWASALPAVGGVVDRAQAGEGSYIENLRMFLDRHGYLEEAFMTFSFSPIRDESGQVGGLFHPITEVTEKMLGARRTQVLRDLAAQLGQAKTEEEVWTLAAQGYDGYALDLPFLLFYRFDEDGTGASLIGAAGLPPGSAPAPAHVDLHAQQEPVWPLLHALRSRDSVQVEDVELRLGAVPCGPYPEPPRTALLLPIQVPGVATPVGCLVAGVSARRALDPTYRAFYETLAATFTTAISNVRAYAQEQRRAEELAALDRAKTAFFSNVSHEFRTPLTLMLGPTEDALASPERALRGADLETVLRNELRLLKLVNALLDFSRIEAGRIQASYEPTDLSALTVDLASAFRSAFERAGVRLTVECPPLPQPVWVDRTMWEKIVLNLLSNAFKFTFEGEVAVRLAPTAGGVELTVEDTGTGIPAHELPRIFERFHRVQGAQGRSYEGSGIGLALVQELVRLHGGEVRATSTLGRGTAFQVSLPSGNTHLPQERLSAATSLVSTATGAAAYLEEVAGWLTQQPSNGAGPHETSEQPPPAFATAGRGAAAAVPQGHLLLADDNADMREYVRRLLDGRYTVEAVENGVRALEAVRARPPDLVLTDVMMPGLDGFGLLRELKADPRTAHIPIILLSARAGEEATLEGLQAGASDYLVKPFSSRELVARVEGALRTALARHEAQAERARMEAVLAALHEGVLFQDASGVARYCNAASEQLLGVGLEQLTGRTSMDPRWHAVRDDESPLPGDEHPPMLALRSGRPVVGHVMGIGRPDGSRVWLQVNAQPIHQADGTLVGVVTSFFDISQDRQRAREAQERAEFEQQLIGIVSHDLRNPLNAILLSASNLLRRADLDERAVKTAARIRASTEQAVRLVRDLLDFTQARLGKGIPIQRQEHELEQYVEHALEDVRTAFPERELLFHAEGDTRGGWDGDRLAQVVHNLTTNALRYGQPGTPVRVSVRGAKDEVLIEVHNQGPAISSELRPNLFKALRRGTHAVESRSGSIGLGLFIVDQVVRAHGGEVDVQSTPGEGTTFIVRLPRKPVG